MQKTIIKYATAVNSPDIKAISIAAYERGFVVLYGDQIVPKGTIITRRQVRRNEVSSCILSYYNTKTRSRWSAKINELKSRYPLFKNYFKLCNL